MSSQPGPRGGRSSDVADRSRRNPRPGRPRLGPRTTPGGSCPIPGTKRATRLEENTAAAAVHLTAAQLDAIQTAADRISIVGARYPEELDRLTNR